MIRTRLTVLGRLVTSVMALAVLAMFATLAR